MNEQTDVHMPAESGALPGYIKITADEMSGCVARWRDAFMVFVYRQLLCANFTPIVYESNHRTRESGAQ